MAYTCEISGLLRSCGRPRIAVCQYCGRSFCEAHGARQGDGQEICARTPCQRKKDDLARHVAYVASVLQRNKERRCGEPACEEPPTGQCSKCRGYYCAGHLRQRDVDVRIGGEMMRTRGSLCRHCSRRRSVWERD